MQFSIHFPIFFLHQFFIGIVRVDWLEVPLTADQSEPTYCYKSRDDQHIYFYFIFIFCVTVLPHIVQCYTILFIVILYFVLQAKRSTNAKPCLALLGRIFYWTKSCKSHIICNTSRGINTLEISSSQYHVHILGY